MKSARLTFLSLLFASAIASAQQTVLALYRQDSVPVFTNADQRYTFPWIGGFNFCQIGELDIDVDGTKDLVIFDRTGDRIIPLIYSGEAPEVKYRHDFNAAYTFPHVEHFALLHDFNCDGKEDLFTYNNTSFQVYKNTGTASEGLQFQLYTNSLESNYTPSNLPIYVIPVDVPVIEDMDGDGDTDLMVFNILGSCVEYHRNMAFETLGRCDTLMLKLETDNWGIFTESFSNNQVTLNDSCDHPSGGFREERHAGSSMMAYDSDGDGDKDLLLGDISYKTITQLINGGTSIQAKITSQVASFPPGADFVQIPVFPACFYVDIDHDGKKDLVVCPNSETGSENNRCIWYYRNNGTAEVPVFGFEKQTLFVEETIDLGEGAIPAFVDYNKDGRLDLVVGNYGYFRENGSYKSQLALYENTGTPESPEFKLITDNFADLASLSGNSVNYHPTFGDIDGDGDDDLITGNSDGRLFLFENTAPLGSPANLELANPNFQNIDVGTFSAPNLVDVDLDGRVDLLIGSKSGFVSYYRNISTGATPEMVLQTAIFGGIQTALPGEPNGFSTPHLFRKNGVSYLISGSQSGYFRIYGNIDGNLSGSFDLIDSVYLGNRDGERTSIAMRDLNADGFPDAVMGNYSGGLVFYKGEFPSGFDADAQVSYRAKLVPTPGTDQLNIYLDNGKYEVSIYNLHGQLVAAEKRSGESVIFNTVAWIPGIYLVKITGKSRAEVLRWIKL